MNDKIEIQKENVLAAYKTAKEAGADSTMKVLESLFGKETFRPKNIMERVKTFDDALNELGDKHPLVLQYRFNFNNEGGWTDDMYAREFEAYLKLRIITAALNEGWTPQFTKDEYRYFPWFWLYTKEEIAKMNKEERKKVVLLGGTASTGASAGFAAACSLYAPSTAAARIRSRLCFKTSALAKYAGEQFAEFYFAFMGK
ncbi:MAG: hypothetical protein NC226_06475 [Bacteroides cellulosilyticus]|nr:hypothetical protein [Bacteroides cellulosilyticus]